MPYATSALREKTILIVEDEYFLADYIAAAITSASGVVDGPFASAKAAMAHLASDAARPDAATLNISLSDGTSYPVADELRRLGIPFVFASAYGSASLPARFARTPILTKPFAAYQVVQALAALTEDDAAKRRSDLDLGVE